MKNTIIKVEGLGKKYYIGHSDKESYTAMRDVITNSVIGLGKSVKRLFDKNISNIAGDEIEEFWALKDLNFEFNKGDIVGIVGRNGAGKSTLLKLLSRITAPTVGRIEMNGRLASLLEVGTGFHPELTGRENIFLNGAILGMSRNEIKKKFDEIVDFSGVEKFLDTPVKRYSSGMYVRLAFAVAANLESEILIVDEVLSVGDTEFQSKCIGKMNEISKGEGRTVLFVSHNLLAIKQLCNKGILLENGSKKNEGEISEVIKKYSVGILDQKAFTPFKIKEIDVTITKITLNEEDGGVILPFKPMIIRIELNADRNIDNIGIQIMISNEDTSGMVFTSNSKTTNNIDLKIKKGKSTVTCLIDSFNLSSGKYWLGFGIDLPFITFYYHNQQLLSFDVPELIIEPRLISTSSGYGHVYLKNEWFITNSINNA
jgi:lipopolysaccharide transport system ATP-binding protein